jgi:hypothetical protein
MDRNYATGGGLATAPTARPTFFFTISGGTGQIIIGKYY